MIEALSFEEAKKLELDKLVGTDTLFKTQQLIEYIKHPLYTSGDLNVTSRILHNWQKEGLIVYPEKKWKRYNFVDYIWIRIMEELRLFGFPLDNLKTLRETLFAPLEWKQMFATLKILNPTDPLPFKDVLEQEREEYKKFLYEGGETDWEKMEKLMGPCFTPLELCITSAVGMKEPMVLLITPAMTMVVNEARLHEYPADFLEAMNAILADTHIKLPLMKIIKAFLVDENLLNVLPKLPIMEENEQRLLEIIHTGNYDSITIHFKDRKIKNLELNKTEDVKRKVVDILQDNEYQDIVIKSHKGLVTTIKNTIKVKFD